MEYQRGLVVKSKAGHDKGTVLAVLKVEGTSLILADGKRRSLNKPKLKKMIHVAPSCYVLTEDKLTTDKKIREALKKLIKDNA